MVWNTVAYYMLCNKLVSTFFENKVHLIVQNTLEFSSQFNLSGNENAFCEIKCVLMHVVLKYNGAQYVVMHIYGVSKLRFTCGNNWHFAISLVPRTQPLNFVPTCQTTLFRAPTGR